MARYCAFGMLWAATAGCASTARLERQRLEDDRTLTSWMVRGETTAAQVIDRFGQPSLSLEGGRLLMFRVQRSTNWREDAVKTVQQRGGDWENSGGGWGGIDYSLVVAHDAPGLYREHSLVPVR
jgi:hypothetical protein